MIRASIVICLLVSCFTIFAYAQEGAALKGEVFGGYQYLHANTGISGVDSFSLNGWNAAVNGYFTRNLGVTADFSGSYGTPSFLGVGVNTKFHTFMFGPAVRFPNSSRVTPFAHALFGGGHFSAGAFGISGSETDFTWAGGGGFDANLTPHVAVRVAQVDFLQSRVAGDSQNHFRYSAGIVLKF
jgi:opacity protein-like surface antigen